MTIYLNRSNLSTKSFKVFFGGPIQWIDPGLSIMHFIKYLSPCPFSCRFIFGCKELPCEVKLYNKTVSYCQCFFFRPVRFLFREARRSSARCVYNKRLHGRQRLYNFILPMRVKLSGVAGGYHLKKKSTPSDSLA